MADTSLPFVESAQPMSPASFAAPVVPCCGEGCCVAPFFWSTAKAACFPIARSIFVPRIMKSCCSSRAVAHHMMCSSHRQNLAVVLTLVFPQACPACKNSKPHHESGHCSTLSSFLALSAESSLLSPKQSHVG